MSQASTSRTIKFISKAGTYTAAIMSPKGDLYQEYEGTTGDVTSVYPDFSQLQPILYFVCTSSRVAEGIADPDAMEYYFNDQKISFSGGASTGTFAGFFKTVAPAGDQPYYGLQILKTLQNWQDMHQPSSRWWPQSATARKVIRFRLHTLSPSNGQQEAVFALPSQQETTRIS